MSENLSNNYYNYSINTRHAILQKLNKNSDGNDKQLDKLNEMHRNDLHYNSFRNISLLTIINLVVLPIGIIVGYFGMNFKKMNNILSINNPQLFVLLLCILSSITLLSFYYKENKYFDLDKDYI